MTLVVLALAAWVVVRSLAYLTGGALRFQVESAASFFVVVGLAARVISARRAIASSPPDAVRPLPVWTVLLWWSSAIVMYWSALWIGFLSDDFVLADHAARGDIGPVTPILFRPIPLALWGLILRVGGGTPAIHLINILLHGTNAYLATRLAHAYVRDRFTILLVGILVLCFPLSAEAVAWASGVFDVMATTWILIGVLIARGYGSSPSAPQRIALWACAAAALLSKETAVIMPLLLALDMWATDSFPRTLIRDVCVLLALDVGVGVIRLTSGSQVLNQPISKFMVQRWIFGTFENAVLPWHATVLHDTRWTVLAGTLAIIGLATAYLSQTGVLRQTRTALAMAGWMLVSTLPVMPIFGVAPDLQGARYMYLASIGWATLVGCFASLGSSIPSRRLATAGALVIALSYLVTLPAHLLPWRRAAGLRDRVEQAASDNREMNACTTVQVAHLPDNFEGAYIMRNGATEAFRRDLGLLISGDAVAACAFSWNATDETFVPQDR